MLGRPARRLLFGVGVVRVDLDQSQGLFIPPTYSTDSCFFQLVAVLPDRRLVLSPTSILTILHPSPANYFNAQQGWLVLRALRLAARQGLARLPQSVVLKLVWSMSSQAGQAAQEGQALLAQQMRYKLRGAQCRGAVAGVHLQQMLTLRAVRLYRPLQVCNR